MEKETKVLLVEQNIRLIAVTVKKYSYTGAEIDELMSAGSVGLVKAAASFKPQKKFLFSTYACRCIKNEILMYLRRLWKYRSHEISENTPVYVDPSGTTIYISDMLGTEPDVVSQKLEAQEERELLLSAVGTLPEREQALIRMRYGGGRDGEGMTQQVVAERLGISQSYVSRLEKRALGYLRHRIANNKRRRA